MKNFEINTLTVKDIVCFNYQEYQLADIIASVSEKVNPQSLFEFTGCFIQLWENSGRIWKNGTNVLYLWTNSK